MESRDKSEVKSQESKVKSQESGAKKILLPYQQAWVSDKGRLKIWLAARQIGKSFSIAMEAVTEALESKCNNLILSSSERQSKEVMQKVYSHLRYLKVRSDEIIKAERETKEEVLLPNGSRIISLPANPDTVRGFSGNVFLDEFAFHKDTREIWRAMYPTVARGYKVRITSTPNGKSNMFYELWHHGEDFSKHIVDIYTAKSQGLKVDIESLKRGMSDPDAWSQEFECQFIDEATAYITYDMITVCEDEGATIDLPDGFAFAGKEIYIGVDIGRKRDLTVIWLWEKLGDVFWTRMVKRLWKAPFRLQQDVLSMYLPFVRRCCIDATGLGMQLAEEMIMKYGSKVEAVTFTNAVKEDLAVTLRRRFEDRQVRIPLDRDIREDIHSVKKFTTSAGNIRFDSERTEAGHCYDSITEILTDSGWKRFSDLNYTDKVASLKGGYIRFITPIEIQNYLYKGEMIRIKNKQIDLLVTPNHRLYVQMPYQKNYEFIEAQSIKDSKARIKFRKDALWEGEEKIFEIGGYKIPSEIWVEFLGYFISQGFTPTSHRVGIYNNNIEETPIRNCLEKLPWRFWIESYKGKTPSYRTKNISLWQYLSRFGKQPDRYLPREVLNLPPDKLLILFNALMFGNGRKGDSTWAYYTVSYQLASDLQELLLKIGLAGSIEESKASLMAKNKRTFYRVNINRTRLRPQINKRRKSISIEKYDGEVYCCTVPSGIIYVRRQGKAIWCGNSDHFWAEALGVHAGIGPSGIIEFETTGVSREFTKMRGYLAA